ncbi:tetratricopeptide repeat protein [Methylomonas sp. DH-1]|uniref:tetratricopeptide repeat protein n=1 Tax=Methylomonas sp. (strain DH-1) TaxID=1727196 RepID=UPI000AA00F8A|nr:tetratricopeptide repeat protein [Methylomonas sp. DH-1]
MLIKKTSYYCSNRFAIAVLTCGFSISQAWALSVYPEHKSDPLIEQGFGLDGLGFGQVPGQDYYRNTPGIFFQDNSELVKQFYYSGLKHLQEGNKEEGVKDLEKAWRLAPNQIPTAVALSNIYLKDKKVENSLDIAKKLQQAQPSVPHGFIIEGFSYQTLGDDKKAIAAFEKALSLGKGEPSASAALAEYALRTKDAQRARSLYLDVLKYNPGHTRTLFLLAGLDKNSGDTKEVEALVADALRKAADDLETHNQFAQIYEVLRNYSQGIGELDKALKIQPDDGYTLFAKARLLASDRQLDAARDILSKLSATYPKSANSRELEARIALEQNKPDEAVVLFQEALKLNDNTPLAIELAVALIRAGKTDDALAVLRTRINSEPTNVSLRAFYAEQLRRNKAFDEALLQYEEIVRQNPDNIAVHNNLAWMLGQKGDIDSGLRHSKIAYEKAPKDPNIADTYAELLLKKGAFAQAEAILLKAYEALPNSNSVRLHLSEAYLQLNKRDQAKKLLTELLAQKGNFDERSQAEELLKSLSVN